MLENLDLRDRNLFLAATIFYGLAACLALYRILRSKPYPRTGLLPLMAIAFLAQTLALNLRGASVGGCPLGNPYEVSQFISWSAVLLYFIIGPACRLRLLGFFTAAFSAILGLSATLLATWDYTYPAGRYGGEPWIELHAALAIFSYGVLTILALVSAMFLLQQHGLKHKHHKGVYALLPSVQQLDTMAWRLLITGTICLSAALIFGALFWLENPDRVPLLKLIMTGVVWLGYLLVVTLRLGKKLVTRYHAYAVISLFIIALLALWPVQTARQPDAAQTQPAQ
ncbi:MAG: Cytochrome c biogenesis protein CcsA [Opitutia bacterium UBA7350]|nr:MAG: Cytochrome c biogenesis protein CcsA [Opitutae bacterium UBA7350]